MLTRRIITGEKIMVARLGLKKGSVVPPHSHVHEQISVIQKGALVFTMGGRDHTARAGDVFCIPSSEVHSVLALRDSVALDIFTPVREDWLRGDDQYLRGAKTGRKQSGGRKSR